MLGVRSEVGLSLLHPGSLKQLLSTIWGLHVSTLIFPNVRRASNRIQHFGAKILSRVGRVSKVLRKPLLQQIYKRGKVYFHQSTWDARPLGTLSILHQQQYFSVILPKLMTQLVPAKHREACGNSDRYDVQGDNPNS